MEWIWIWVGVIAVSFLVEFSTMEMVSIWTGIGGICALILAALKVKYEIQLIVFFVVSIVLLLSLRKLALKYLLKNNNQKVGTDRVVGTKTKLLTAITPDDAGTIKVNGVVWSAITENGEPLAVNTIVEIVEIRGNKFVVKKEN